MSAEVILYRTDDGKALVRLRAMGESVWLSQMEIAELRVEERQTLTLDYWRQNVDRMLAFNDRPVLDHAGRISNDDMKLIASERYEIFDQHRRRAEALAADEEDLKTLEAIEERAKRNQT